MHYKISQKRFLFLKAVLLQIIFSKVIFLKDIFFKIFKTVFFKPLFFLLAGLIFPLLFINTSAQAFASESIKEMEGMKVPEKMSEKIVAQQKEQCSLSFLVFISGSLPNKTIKNLYEQLDRLEAEDGKSEKGEKTKKNRREEIEKKLLIKGFIGNDLKKTIEKRNEIFGEDSDSGGFDVDPERFDQFGITKVPAFVLAQECFSNPNNYLKKEWDGAWEKRNNSNKREEKNENENENEPEWDVQFDVVYGEMSVEAALMKLKTSGSEELRPLTERLLLKNKHPKEPLNKDNF